MSIQIEAIRPLGPASDAFAERLIRTAFPQARDLPITRFDNGLDNDMFAVGDEWLARLPRRAEAPVYMEQELFVLPHLPDLGLAVPELVAIGEATPAYPTRFLLQKRLPGAQPSSQDTFDGEDARRLAQALRTLHSTPPPTGIVGDVNGLLAVERFPRRLEQTLPNLAPEDCERYERPMRNLIESPCEPLDETRAWVHGDLHVRNVLRHEGRLSALIDWGDSHLSHPALDFAGVHALLNPEERKVFFNHYGPVPESWRQAGRKRGALTALVLLALATEAEDKEGRGLARASLDRCFTA